jgi:hypothetical protein
MSTQPTQTYPARAYPTIKAARCVWRGVSAYTPRSGSRSIGVTAWSAAHSIGCVAFPRIPALTRRRAVDFCRVATALCP